MKFSLLHVVSLLATLSMARPVDDVVARITEDLPRLVVYFQTTHDKSGNPISMLPLITEKNISLTHLIVCSFHINLNSVVHLNDYPPSDARFDTLWNETRVLRNNSSVKVMGMIGGAAPGSFNTQTLDGNATSFAQYYGQLRDVISTYGLQGMDLDVEQSMSQAGITRLIKQLYADFGPDFIITLAPVATALEQNGGNLSGFDYGALEAAVGDEIAFYNGQFYNGFGSMANTAAFDAVVANGWAPEKILAGQPTSSADGSGFIPYSTLNATIIKLRSEYGEIGGIMGWEYFNSQPGGLAEPWEWAQYMTAILRPNSSVALTITKETAYGLEAAWRSSVSAAGGDGMAGETLKSTPMVDYMAMLVTMKLFNKQLLAAALISISAATSAQPENLSITSAASPSTQVPLFITKIWSTTETTVSYPGWFGPTIFSMITTRTVTTIDPVVTSYPATFTEEVISSVTWEYRYYYSDGSSLTSISSGVYTKTPTITLAGPTATAIAVAGR
ncbi:Chitinase [Lachnellula suecica]|uniref:Chitinase n=1 Tax=Lachnellula suecica TaxID=602035 RepID=A0A8T9CH08_9HELO|nr:Chitinase [Lachnellula suecica]